MVFLLGLGFHNKTASLFQKQPLLLGQYAIYRWNLNAKRWRQKAKIAFVVLKSKWISFETEHLLSRFVYNCSVFSVRCSVSRCTTMELLKLICILIKTMCNVRLSNTEANAITLGQHWTIVESWNGIKPFCSI